MVEKAALSKVVVSRFSKKVAGLELEKDNESEIEASGMVLNVVLLLSELLDLVLHGLIDVL